jgi:hypothetical protein
LQTDYHTAVDGEEPIQVIMTTDYSGGEADEEKKLKDPIWVTSKDLIIAESLSTIYEVTEADDSQSGLYQKTASEVASKKPSKLNLKNWFKSTAPTST